MGIFVQRYKYYGINDNNNNNKFIADMNMKKLLEMSRNHMDLLLCCW